MKLTRNGSNMISVVIITYKREDHLFRCLQSVSQQTNKPDEVIIIDNDRAGSARKILPFFAKLPIKFAIESRKGIPFARNKGISLARGKFLFFIDDDCVADKNWIKNALQIMTIQNFEIGIGKTTPVSKEIPSNIEDLFYRSWLLSNIGNLNKTKKIKNGELVDFKNCVVHRKLFKKAGNFSIKAPFGEVGDEDVEIGKRLLSATRRAVYIQDMKVAHCYSNSIVKLFRRNLYSGMSRYYLERDMNILRHFGDEDKNTFYSEYVFKELFKKINAESVMTIGITALYLFFGRLGYYLAYFMDNLGYSNLIPSR